MKRVGISVDYSNICKDYNTSYLDRDNSDPATTKCMREVLAWSHTFLSQLLGHMDAQLYHVNSATAVKIEDVASKRFLFYSLEKEITLQSFLISKEAKAYASLSVWEEALDETLLVQNDEDGASITFFMNDNSKIYTWIKEQLQAFSLDEVPFEAIR